MIETSWQHELYQIYDHVFGTENGQGLLPVSHSTAMAQIEMTLDEDGNFLSARRLPKEEAQTVIPVTEDSASRTSGPCPMPYADKLIYLAGDYTDYAGGKKSSYEENFIPYKKQLREWADSPHSHRAVRILYAYICQEHVMADLVQSGVLVCGEESGRLKKGEKIAGIEQEDAFVRFRIAYRDLTIPGKTWEDQSLQESFIAYLQSKMPQTDLCYATGWEVPVTYKHPKKIRSTADGGKLISANDESGFSYRGRFADKTQAFCVGYEFSQKMHLALRWLIQRQGMHFDSLTLLVWTQSLAEVPEITMTPLDWEEKKADAQMDAEEDDPFADFSQDPEISSEPQYKRLLSQIIYGYRERMPDQEKILILALDSATTGRVGVSLYEELFSSDFYEHLLKWHEQTSAFKYNGRHHRNEIGSFCVDDIAYAALGTEQSGKLTCDKSRIGGLILRLLPCMTMGQALPRDIVENLYHNASNPLAYEKGYNHRMVLEAACGMIRKYNIENRKGVTGMAYDPNETNRSYLFGCLLAVADKAERETYDKEENGRETNARRYWNRFSERPYQTWKVIEERLIPYYGKLGSKKTYYERKIEEIMDKMSLSDFTSDRPLDPEYLLGYHQFTAQMYTKAGDNSQEEEE